MSTTLSKIGDTLWDSVTSGGLIDTVFGTLEERKYRKQLSKEGLNKQSIQKRAELNADDFLPVSAVLAANRDSLASQRNAEVNRLLTLPKTDAKTGQGTLAAFGSSAGQASVKLPEEIPSSPTAFQLSKQMANNEIVEELLKRSDFVRRQKGVVEGVARGGIRGMTLGIVGQRDMEDPLTQAQLIKDPLSKGEVMTEATGELVGSFVPYSGIAKVVGSSFRTVSAINRFATKNPFLFGATVSNLGEELVDMGVRKGTGQEYNQNDFILGIAMGGAFEGIFAGVRGAKDARLIQAQLNKAASQLKEYTPKALYEAVRNQKVEGLDITYESLFKEHRLAYYRQVGREGIDRPAPPPEPTEKSLGAVGGSDPVVPKEPLRLYRGGTSYGKYLSSSKNVAEGFAKNRGGSVSEFTVSPNAKIASYFDFPDAKYKGIDDYNMGSFAQGKDLKTFQDTLLESDYIKAEKWAKNNGFDAMKFPTEGEVRIINDKVLTPQPLGGSDTFAPLMKEARIDQGTMLPNDIGEQRRPGLKGDENLKMEKIIRDNNTYARKVVKPYVDEYINFRRESKFDIGEEGIGISNGQFATGQALRKEMEYLKSRGVFKFKHIKDVGALDADSAYKLLAEAWDYHQGKPAQELIGKNRPAGMETFSDDGADLIDDGYRAGPDDITTNLYDNFKKMIDEEYQGITIDTLDFDGKGTSVRQLLHDLEEGAILRSEKASETRRLNAERKRNIVSDAGVRPEAEVRKSEPERVVATQKEEILPEQVKVFSKPVRSEADIEIMFEPTMRGHLSDFVNKTLNSRYISSFGNEGKAIADMIDKADEISSIKIGIDIDELSPIMRGMNEIEIARFPDIAEGKIAPVTPKETELFNFWSMRRAEIAEQAQRSGLTVRGTDGIDRPFVPRDNYYPRVVSEASLKEIRSDPKKANAMFEGMIQKSNGQIKSITEAKKIFNNIIKDRTQKRYGNLERAREVDFLPDDMLIRDPRKVLSSYLQAARKRIADAQTLGAKQENAIRLIEDARVRGADADTMLSLLRRATGEEIFNQGEVQLSRLARTYNNFTKLSLASVTNMGDVVKPFVRTGEFFTTLKGIVKSFTEGGATQARRSGAVEANLRSLLEDAGDTKLSDAFFKYTGFTFTETKIRSFNANAAIAHAEVLVKRLSKNPANAFAYRRLAQWLEDPDAAIKRGFLTQAEKDIVGFRGIADTQPLRRLDLPFYWQKPSVKVLTQFKTFAYKHMTFMKKFVIDEARQGNVRPLIAFLVMGQIVGESVGDMKAAIRNRERPDDVTRRIIDNYMTIGGIGLATDFLSNLQYGSLGGGFLKFVAGPTLTDVDDWLTRIVSNNREDRIYKKAIGMFPVLGPAAAQYYYPTKNTYKARTIPIAEDVLQLLEPSGTRSGRSSDALSRASARRSSTRINPYR